MKYRLSGLYAITDKKLIARAGFVGTVENAIRGGVRVLQLREKDTEAAEVVSLGKDILKITKSYGIPLIINDCPEIAKEIGADGVHLGENDVSIEHARSVLGPEAIVGVSCYERGIKAQKNGADYAAFGTPYYTPTKPDRSPTHLEVLREARERIDSIPLFAIGGITKDNAACIMETGVDGIAAITSIFGTDDPENAARELAAIAGGRT